MENPAVAYTVSFDRQGNVIAVDGSISKGVTKFLGSLKENPVKAVNGVGHFAILNKSGNPDCIYVECAGQIWEICWG
jgi:hypothetical protein